MFLRSFQKNSLSELCYAPVCNSSIFWKIDIRSVIRQKSQSQNEFFKKTKHAKFFKKGTFHTPWYAHVGYQGVKSVRFSEIWRALFSWKTRFEIRSFTLLPTITRARRIWTSNPVYIFSHLPLFWSLKTKMTWKHSSVLCANLDFL